MKPSPPSYLLNGIWQITHGYKNLGPEAEENRPSKHGNHGLVFPLKFLPEIFPMHLVYQEQPGVSVWLRFIPEHLQKSGFKAGDLLFGIGWSNYTGLSN